MKKLFFILTSYLFISLPAFAYNCAEYDFTPEIEFYYSYGNLTYDYSKDATEITAIAEKYGIMEQGLFASGLATADVEWEISADTVGKVISSYNICVIPEKIKVYIGFANPTIYIAKELSGDECKKNLVIRHEQTHQQINKTALDYHLPLFEKAFKKIVGQIKAVHATNISEVDQASAELTKQYNKKLSPLIKSFKQELLTEQQKLDNPENYLHEQQLCP